MECARRALGRLHGLFRVGSLAPQFDKAALFVGGFLGDDKLQGNAEQESRLRD